MSYLTRLFSFDVFNGGMKEMKLLSLFLGTLFLSTTALAVTVPNLHECTDREETVRVTYTTAGKNGEATFHYSRLADGPGGRNVRVNRSRDIHREDTILGHLVSVFDDERSIPDRSSESISLVVPGINLASNRDTAKFDTVVIETTLHTSFAGPAFVNGAIQESRCFQVTCSARHDDF